MWHSILVLEAPWFKTRDFSCNIHINEAWGLRTIACWAMKAQNLDWWRRNNPSFPMWNHDGRLKRNCWMKRTTGKLRQGGHHAIQEEQESHCQEVHENVRFILVVFRLSIWLEMDPPRQGSPSSITWVGVELGICMRAKKECLHMFGYKADIKRAAK